MTCGELRERLLDPRAATGVAGERHLAGCPSCARFARRLDATRQALSSTAGHTPDPGFVERVASRLPGRGDLVGQAAWRMLPATVALALALAGWCLLATPSPWSAVESGPSDDPLAWVAELEPELGESGR